MRLSKISKEARIFCGSQLLILGYLPILIGLWGSGSRVLDISESASRQSLEVFASSPSGAAAVGEKYLPSGFHNLRKPEGSFIYSPAYASVNGVLLDTRNISTHMNYFDGVLASSFSNMAFIRNDLFGFSRSSPAKISSMRDAVLVAKASCEERSIANSIRGVATEGKNFVDHLKVISYGEFAGSLFVKSKISSNFYADARRIGVPAKVIDVAIGTLSTKIDFRRSLKRGDSFEILYNKKNEMIYAKISTKRTTASVFGFAAVSGKGVSYYFENGERVSSGKGGNFFGSPLAGKLSISDGFGMRRHPFTGKYVYHSGVDLRAPYGSPIYAIMDGVVTRASYYCGYGYCVDVRHSSGYSSRYGHLSKFAVRYGERVKKGQVLGYIGSSGLSTGPHLHLELAKNNRNVNPLGVKMMPKESSLAPKRQFEAFKTKIRKTTEKF